MSLLFALLVVAQAGAPAQAPPKTEEAQTPAITIQKAEAPGATVFFLNIPWGPQTFAMMERPGDSFYNLRIWPFARLETQKPLTLEGTAVAPGNYALLFHPNTPDDKGMSLEMREIPGGEFLAPGNVMTKAPVGETIWRAPVRFDTAEGTTPALKIEILPGKSGFQLKVRYGDRWTIREFHY
jgi:hypothetical protein